MFTDFPLGNPCGRPNDIESQTKLMSYALGFLETASLPGQCFDTKLQWQSEFDWKTNYMYVGPENIEALKAAGDERRAKQAALRTRMLKTRKNNSVE